MTVAEKTMKKSFRSALIAMGLVGVSALAKISVDSYLSHSRIAREGSAITSALSKTLRSEKPFPASVKLGNEVIGNFDRELSRYRNAEGVVVCADFRPDPIKSSYSRTSRGIMFCSSPSGAGS